MAAKWNIANLDRQVSFNGKSDVVTNVHWQITDPEAEGSSNDAVGLHKVFGVASLDTSDLSSFTAYADIKESDAIAWAKAVIGADQVTAYEKSVVDLITESKTPTTNTGVPW